MYESPINIYEMQRDIHRKMIQDQEEKVMECIWEYGINVDKKELIKALKYDRHQYSKGYRDGYEDGKEQEKWIPCSERLPKKGEYDGDVAKYYLVQNEYGDMLVARYTHSEYWEQIYQLKPIADEIIAWRELPQPYTEREGV